MKTLIAAGLVATAAAFGFLSGPQTPPQTPPFDPPELVSVAAGEIAWRPFGTFSLDGKARTPRPVPLTVPAFEIMKYQVTRAQYAACVADGGCAPATPADAAGAFPQTQVSWQDATAFADWYSDRTGESWRLPTEPEWQRAAAERHGDAAADPEAQDPGQRMLSSYRNGVFLRNSAGPALRPSGGFGVNALGVADIAGNVWDWTDGCLETGTLRRDGTVAASAPRCWVRIAGGAHRAAVVDFVRDTSVGGCAVGLPPDHLGFRLVRARDEGAGLGRAGRT